MNKVDEKEIARLKRLYCQKSLYYFAEALGFNRLYHPLHYELCKEISNLDNTQGLFLLPRGVFKTTLGSITFCIWLTIQDYLETIGKPGREIRILLAKENATLAEHDLASIEAILDNNEIIKAIFPDLVPPPTTRSRWNRQEMMVNRKSSWPEATITTIGVGGAAQGMHFDCIVYDDIIGDDAKNSDIIMERTIEWFDYSQSLLISPTKSLVRIYGTRWSKRDIYQHIIDNYPRVKVYTRSIIENNQSIFPEVYPLHILDEMRERNPVHYFGQLCNNPIDPGKCEFKPEWIKKYEFQRGKDDELLIKFEDDPLPLDIRSFDIVGAYDPSVDESPKASRRAIVYTAMDSKQRVAILDCYASRESVDAVLDRIFNMFHHWHPRKFSIESVALSRIYIDLVQKEAKIRNTWIAAQPFKVSSRQSKDSRIRDAIQQVAAEGRLYCLQSFRDLQQEFIDFPNGKTKDILDALSMCIQTHQPPISEEERKYSEDYDEYVLQSRNKVTGY
jgi:hypothetical protein